MEISKAQVEKILKTLPIGYYIKRDVKTSLGDDKCSYYNIMNDEIVISFEQLQETLKNVNDVENIENYIRCMLYHETSHAFLTPKELKINDINNIVEDERIETILRHYYHGVDFRKFVKLVNNYQGEAPNSAKSLFYQIVRYRVGPKELLDDFKTMLDNYLYLGVSNGTWCYENDIQRFYNKVETYFNQFENKLNRAYNQMQNGNNSNDKNENDNSNDNTQQSGNMLGENINTNVGSEAQELEITNQEQLVNDQYDGQVADEKVQQFIKKYDSIDVERDINQILSMYRATTKQNGSAINAYSGRFDPRSVVRSDYKFFIQQNRLGHVKAFSKLHLNLFIDCSGSFSGNDLTVNKMLKALTRIEKQNPNFEFDLISCGFGQKLRDKNDRIQKSQGGTGLTDTIFKTFRDLQKPDANNFNIVMYDGDMFEGYYKHKYEHIKNVTAFDTSNTVIIADNENEYCLKKLAKAKVVITRRYVDELYKNVIAALHQMIRN